MKAYDGAKPSVGRIVHYYGKIDSYRPDIPYAALIVGATEGDDMRVNLFIFLRGSFDEELKGVHGVLDSVPFCAEGNQANSWTWPLRV